MHRTPFAWLVMATFVFGALVTAVMPVLRGADATWIEICTRAGSTWVNAETGATDSPAHAPGQGGASGHCPLCSLQTPVLGLPEPAQAALPPPVTEHRISDRITAPRPQARAWALAPSRAPPTSS